MHYMRGVKIVISKTAKEPSGYATAHCLEANTHTSDLLLVNGADISFGSAKAVQVHLQQGETKNAVITVH